MTRRVLLLAVGLFALVPSAIAQTELLKRVKPASVGAVDEHGVYRMSAEEQGYDCKKLTGRMQLRILEIRDYNERTHGTSLAQGLKSITSSLSGRKTSGAASDARYEADRAMLEAYNQRLASKECRTFDLEAELKPKAPTETPTPLPRRKSP